MDANQPAIPRLLGIGRDHEEAPLALTHSDKVLNHVGSVHASAQFALAELASGDYLREQFPGFEGRVLPLLRDAQIQFRKVANSDLQARCRIDPAAREAFVDRLERRRRASITVNVELVDADDQVTAIGEYHWFIQRL